MMLQLTKIGCFMFICILSSIQGTQATCANITNLTRISATSVVVEWEHHQSSHLMLMSLEFDITVSDFENSSVIHQLTITLDTTGRYVYLVNNTADAQLLCFMISVATDSPMLPPSSGQMMTAEDMCPKECLPSKPGQIPAAPEGFTATNTTTSFSDVEFSWTLTDSLVILACTPSGSGVPTIIKEFCGSSSPVTVGGFMMHSSQYTCSLSQKSGAIVGHRSVIDFITDAQRLPSPDFNITTTTITAQITGLSGFLWEYQLSIILLQANGEKTYVSDRLDGGQPTETTVIRNLYPFTMYNIELQVRRSTTDPWSYPASREVKTLEEAPAKIPRDSVSVHTMSITPPIILVAWKPPGIANGSIISYEYCWSTGACENTTGNSTIINLPINSNSDGYTVTVAATTRGGRGPYSDNIYVYIPKADTVAPITSYTSNPNDRTSYIQLKFKGLYNCSFWLTEQEQSIHTLQDDIRSDLLTQLSNLCNCSLLSSDNIISLTLQCNNASEQHTDEVLLQAKLNNSTSSSRELLDLLEQWITGPFPSVTVSILGLQLRLDRSCPLYATSATSNECLDPSPTSEVATGSSNGGAIAGALIGGILLGVILTIGVGSVIVLLLLWWRQRGGNKKAQMMKKVDPNVGTTLAKRYIPSTENLHQESNEAGYEPITAYIKDGAGDRRAGNTYELQAKEQDAAKQKKQKKKSIKESNDAGYEPITAYIKDGDGDRRAHELQANEQDAAKQKKQKKKSNKDSGKNVIEDESGYVVPDTLWEEKQRPVAPGSAASAQTPGKTSKNTIPAPETVTKVEYDVPEGIEHRDTSKVKGQREPQSERQAPTSNLDQKEHVQQAPTGKDHRKQKLQAKEPSKITSQPEQSQNNESAAVQGGKPAKKNKPILHQKKENSSKLALQYQSNTSASSFGKSGAAATSTAAPQAHNAVKSKLQNLLTPAVSSQPTKPIHAKLSKQPSTSAKESAKVQQQQQQQEPQQTSKVMAMAQKLQGVGQASTTAGPETTDSKTSGAKKKPILLPKNIGSSTATSAHQQQHQQASGASEAKTSHLLPTLKPKPPGKGTVNIAMKSNTAYEKWSREEDGIAPTQNPSGRSYVGGGRGNENVYRS